MKIGIISDTHGLLRPEVIKALDGCEAILHGGDISYVSSLFTHESVRIKAKALWLLGEIWCGPRSVRQGRI